MYVCATLETCQFWHLLMANTRPGDCLANRGRVTPSSRGRARVSSSVWRHHLHHQHHALVSVTWPPRGSHFYCHITIILTLLFMHYVCGWWHFCFICVFQLLHVLFSVDLWMKTHVFVLSELLYCVKYDVSAEV